MAISKGFQKAIDVYNREIHTSLWYLNDQWHECKKDFLKYWKQDFIAGRYVPKKNISPADKVRIWQKYCGLTKACKFRGIWNSKTFEADLQLQPGAVISLDEYKAEKTGTTLLNLIRANREEERRKEERPRTRKHKPKKIKPEYMMFDPYDRKRWMEYWRTHKDQQREMIEYRQCILNKKIERKRKKERLCQGLY